MCFAARNYLTPVLAAAALCGATGWSHGQSLGVASESRPTLGGRTAWSDELILYEWRIQRHAVLGVCRLLDPDDRQIVQGTMLQCQRKLQAVKRQEHVAPLAREVVIVVHGLGGYRHRMQGIADHLTRSGFVALNFGYASTRDDISVSASSLAKVVRNLHGVQTVNFVAHSMGNIVIRRYLHDLEQMPAANRPSLRFGRLVMIAPPNHGAEILDNMDKRQFAKLIVQQRGGPYRELSPAQGWTELERNLATPAFEFGVIAGGQGDDLGYFPEIPGDDDGLLSVATMQLDGAADYLQTGGTHQSMPDYRQVREATVNFLRNGYFVSAESRQPLLATR